MGGDLNLRTNFRYVGKQYDTLQYTDRFLTTRKAQTYVDARAAYNFGASRQYQIAVYGENLTSQKACYSRDLQDSPVIYTSIGLRQDVPEAAGKEDSRLSSDVRVGEPVSFSPGPIQSSSPIFKIAVTTGDLAPEEQEEQITKATMILAEGFVEVNKDLDLDDLE